MSDKDLDELKAIVTSTQTLIAHLLDSLKVTTTPDIPEGEIPPNALALASTVASLIHAQTTKLSLLVVNKPFTPTAISKIVKTLSAECIPALASAAQISATSGYPKCVHSTIVEGARTILLEFQSLLGEIPVDERGVEQTQNRGTFSYTGVIWAACDKLKADGAGGVHEIAAAKANGFLSLVKDALEELQEWKEAGEEDPEDEDEDDDEQDDSDSMNMIMDSKCPKKMLPTASHVINVIDHIRLLYPPLVKRRIKRFPNLSASTKVEDFPPEESAGRLDGLLQELEILHDEVDQAAFVLYERGHDEAMEQIRKLGELAEKCASSMASNWAQESDELTPWITAKYLPKLKELTSLKVRVPE